MNKLLVLFVGCVVLAVLCVAGSFAAMADDLPFASAWFGLGFLLFSFLACLVKLHAEARSPVRPPFDYHQHPYDD